jgi:hypothetical protein
MLFEALENYNICCRWLAYFAVAAISGVLSRYSSANWTQEGGDPCLPVPWSWVHCSSDPQPRIISM